MARLDDICREVIGGLNGSLACGVVDLSSGRLLGAHSRRSFGETAGEALPPAAIELLGSPALANLSALLRARTGTAPAASEPMDEVYVNGERQLFAKVLSGGSVAVVLLTDETTAVGWGWVRLRSAVRQVQSLVP
jgi:hypothetical protein